MRKPKPPIDQYKVIREFGHKQLRPSFNIQAFVDARVVAGIHNYLAGVGAITEPKYSTLVGVALEAFYDVLVNNKRIEPITSPHAALETLRSAGYSMIQLKDGRRNRVIRRQLAAESMDVGEGNFMPALESSLNQPIETTGNLVDGERLLNEGGFTKDQAEEILYRVRNNLPMPGWFVETTPSSNQEPNPEGTPNWLKD